MSGKKTQEPKLEAEDVVGVVGTPLLPHLREHCTIRPFGMSLQENVLCCDRCYCYVCDRPVNECMLWDEHCFAQELMDGWQELRLAVVFASVLDDTVQ
jgi:hypothetical protein